MNDAKGCYDRIDHTFAILVLMFLAFPGALLLHFFLYFNRLDIASKLDTDTPSRSTETSLLALVTD